MRPRNRRCLALAVMAATLAVMPACSGGNRAGGNPVSLTMQDFRISAVGRRVPAGTVRLEVHNKGPSTHELVVVRTRLPAGGLPVGGDGISVNEDSPLIEAIGELPDVPLGESQTLVVDLSPGRYVLICNLEGHYLGGMHLVLEAA